MIYMIVTLTLLTICAAENRLTARSANDHGYSQPKKRHNMALPYMYGVPHYYTRSTVKPLIRTGEMAPNYFKKIQYAPLYDKFGAKTKNIALENTKVPPTHSSVSVTPTEFIFHTRFRKDHLEPRRAIVQEPVVKCYSPGADGSVSRSPGHNAVYRTLSDANQKDEPMQTLKNLPSQRHTAVIHFVPPFVDFPSVETSTAMMPFELPREDSGSRPFINNRFILNPNIADPPGINVEKIKRQYSPYAKFHRLHLNIARVYSPGLPPKPQSFADASYSMAVGKHQSYMPSMYKAIADHKPVLYPKDSPKSYRFRLP